MKLKEHEITKWRCQMDKLRNLNIKIADARIKLRELEKERETFQREMLDYKF